MLAFASYVFTPCADIYTTAPNNKAVQLRTVAQKTADKLGKLADRDPNNAYGYGIISAKIRSVSKQ